MKFFRGKEKKKPKDISPEAKATLEVFIHELQSVIKKARVGRKLPATRLTEDINKLVETWVEANKLHPEKVIVITKKRGTCKR